MVSGMVTDLAEVFRLGTAKAKENVTFRRYLSAHHYSDNPFQILASDVQQQVDCTACANCCRHSVVSVNKSEIENIASHIGATPEEVARLYTVPDPDTPARPSVRSTLPLGSNWKTWWPFFPSPRASVTQRFPAGSTVAPWG